MTSLAKAFSDMQLSACVASAIISRSRSDADRYVRSTDLWEGNYSTCSSSVANALMLAAPFWWRLMQCLKGECPPLA